MVDGWTRRFPKPIGKFRSLADVRDYILERYPDGPPGAWRLIGLAALEAEETGDTAGVEDALRVMVSHGDRALTGRSRRSKPRNSSRPKRNRPTR